MSPPKRRPTYYQIGCLRDGTVLFAWPVRKPTPHILKRDGQRIDEDNICKELDTRGDELSDCRNEGRTRFQDIVANSLNVRRALRQLVVTRLDKLECQLEELRAQMDRIEGRAQARSGES